MFLLSLSQPANRFDLALSYVIKREAATVQYQLLNKKARLDYRVHGHFYIFNCMEQFKDFPRLLTSSNQIIGYCRFL